MRSHALKAGDQVSHYQVVSLLGSGGMGEVYEARDTSLGRAVALKVLPTELVRDGLRLQRFVQEAKSASSLSHPNIVTIHEIGHAEVPSSGEIHFIAMELVVGHTLRALIHDQGTDLRKLLRFVAQAAEGLAKAHAAGIVHRDLKPENIMVTRDGHAKVLDFGLAKLTETEIPGPDATNSPTETLRKTGEGVVLGTVGYMSPEQVVGQPADHRSDIFSLGCILYESATRRKPFAGASSVETMHKILKDKPVPIEELNAEAPAELRRLIRRCLAKDPDQRIDSMKTLALELNEIVTDYDALSASASSGSGVAAIRPAKRTSAFVAFLVIAGVLVTAAALAAGWMLHRAGGDKASPAFQSMKMTVLPGRGDVGAAALSPDGHYLAYISGPLKRRSIWVRQVSTGSDVEVFHGATPPDSVAFASDGEHLFFVSQDQDTPAEKALYEIPVLGGRETKLASHVEGLGAIAPDGASVCFSRYWPDQKRTEMVVLDLGSGRERILASTTFHLPSVKDESRGYAGGWAWSPDGKKIVTSEWFRTESGAGDFLKYRTVVLDARDGSREVVTTDPDLGTNRSSTWLPDGRGLVIAASGTKANPAGIWLVDYPGGRARRITNDTNDYWFVSVSAAGSVLAAIRAVSVGNLWTMDPTSGSSLRQLTQATAQEHTVARYLPPRDGSVVFWSNGKLWRISADLSDPVPLWTNGAYGPWLSLLPSGGVVFARAGVDRVTHIWRIDSDGGNLRQLTTGTGELPMAISPDGQTLIFAPTNGGSLWSLPVKGGAPRLLLASFPFVPLYTGLSYLPAGDRLIYRDNREVDGKTQRSWKVISAVTGAPITSLSLETPVDRPDLEWAADGKSLTFLRELDGVANIYRQQFPGGTAEPVTHFTDRAIRDHEWSPDGRRLLLVRGDGVSDNVWMTAADGSQAVQLTNFKAGWIDGADWFPDGRRIVFRCIQENRDVVLLRDFQ